MATVIQSKRIFQTQNEKVVNNKISKVSVEENSISKAEKEFESFSFTPFTTNNFSFKVLWAGINYSYYDTSWNFGKENVFSNGIKTINGISCHGVGFRIKSDYFIDTRSVNVTLSMKYRYGEGYSGNALSRPAFINNSNLQNLEKITRNFIFDDSYSGLSLQRLVLPRKNNIPDSYAEVVLNTGQKRSKSFIVTVFVPTYYNPQYNEQTGTIDSIVFEGFDISISAKEYKVSSKSNKTYGDGNQNFGTHSNEFFQSYVENVDGEKYPFGTFFESKDGNVSASENLCKKIIENYKGGKETAVIRCSIPEDLSVLNIGNEVIPMVYGADGVDRPMSRYKDGTPKVFVVVGTKFIYDGAVWQELTLQEKTQSV